MTGCRPIQAAAILLGLVACSGAIGSSRPNRRISSCATAIECHIEGLRWLRQEDPRAEPRLEQVCRGELSTVNRHGHQVGPYGPSCLALGKALEADGEIDRANQLFAAGCELAAEARACRRLGERLLVSTPDDATEPLRRGCELGDAKSCLLVATRYQELADAPPAGHPRSELIDLASNAYKRACGLTGNRAVCETGSDLRTAAIVAKDVEDAVSAEAQSQREAREAADRAIREADEKREAARWEAAQKLEIPVHVTTSLRCEDGVVERFPVRDDLLVWIVFPDGALQANLASWNLQWRVRNGLTLEGARGGRGATLTGHLIRDRWVWIYELEAKVTRSGRFRRGVLTTQVSTGDGDDCVSTAEIERRQP